MNSSLVVDVDIKHFHLFCGLGGGAKGFNKGQARVGNLRAKFRCIGGIDSDAAAIRDFDRLAGVRGTVMDLFDYDQYVAFHGKQPPAGWRQAMPDDIRRAAHGEFPNIVFLSAPCKGFSGLLPEASSATAKYQALNRLTVRGVWLMLEAFKDDLPELIIFENVPRIMTRGRGLLDQISALLRPYGYEVAETTHDCGELGGLGQSRKRFLLVARLRSKVPPHLYQPEKKRLRGVGEILEKFPLPGDPLGGPMHRVPALQWKTWVRLAFVEAGSDWRSLNKLAVENGHLRDFGIVPTGAWRDDILGVLLWDGSSGVITGNAGPTTGTYSVADPRKFSEPHNGALGVKAWEDTAGVVTANGRPESGMFSVSDPRAPEGTLEYKQYGVREWDDTMGAIIHVKSPGQGRFAVADPRVDGHPKSVQLGVRGWAEPTGVVKGDMSVGGGPYAVTDPRIGRHGARFNNIFRIVKWEDVSPALTGGGGPTAGGLAIADPRSEGSFEGSGKYRVTSTNEPAGTIIAASTTGQGAFALADPNVDWGPDTHPSKLKVKEWGDSADAVTGSRFGSGAGAVADPRPGKPSEHLHGKFHVTPFDDPARAVIGGRENGAYVVADPRPGYSDGAHQNILHVAGWDGKAKTVIGATHVAGGAQSVADPRGVDEQAESMSFTMPRPDERLVAVIRALDGTWHRPFTTLELAALQSLVDPDEMFAFDGQSDSAWRERIGNAVPPDAAAAIAGVMGTTLLLAMSGQTFMLSSQDIWVQPLAIALSVDQEGNIPNERI